MVNQKGEHVLVEKRWVSLQFARRFLARAAFGARPHFGLLCEGGSGLPSYSRTERGCLSFISLTSGGIDLPSEHQNLPSARADLFYS